MKIVGEGSVINGAYLAWLKKKNSVQDYWYVSVSLPNMVQRLCYILLRLIVKCYTHYILISGFFSTISEKYHPPKKSSVLGRLGNLNFSNSAFWTYIEKDASCIFISLAFALNVYHESKSVVIHKLCLVGKITFANFYLFWTPSLVIE